MSSTARRRPARDEGFTLPELLISIVILSFIAGAIGFALMVSLRTTRATADRTLSNLGGQTLSAWFAGDVESTAPIGGADTTPAGASACPGEDPGQNVLTLRRADDPGRYVSYRLVAGRPDESGAIPYQLVRVSCPQGTRIVNVVGQGIGDPTDVVVEPADLQPAGDAGPGTSVDVVRLTVTIGRPNPVNVTVTGTVRDAATLDTPCRLVNVTPRTLGVDTTTGSLLVAPHVHVNVAGQCGSMRLRIDRGAAGDIDVPLQSMTAERWTDLDKGSGWSARDYLATVTDDAGFSATFTMWVTAQPCTVSRLEPDALEYRPLGTGVDLTVTTAGPCPALQLAFEPKDGGGEVKPPVVRTSDTTWTVSVADDMDGWSPGRKTVRALDGADVDLGRLSLTATPAPCRFVSSSTDLLPRTDASQRLLYDLQVRVKTDGVCRGVGVSIPTGVTEAPVSVDPIVPVVTDGPIDWTARLTRCASPGNPCPGQKWVPGTRDVTVVANGDVLATFPLEILEVCSMIGTSPGGVTLGADRRPAAPTPITITTRGTCGRVSLGIATNGTPVTYTTNLASAGSTHTTTLQPCDARFGVGARTVTVSNDGQALGSFTLNATQGPGTITGPPLVIVTASSPRRVPADTPITIGGVRACGDTLQVRYPTGTNQPTNLIVGLTPGPNETLLGTITPAGAQWTTDIVNPRTATVTANGQDVGTYLFVVSDCVVTTASGSINVNSSNQVRTNQSFTFQAQGSSCSSNMLVRFTPPGSSTELVVAANRSGGTYRVNVAAGTAWTRGGSATVSVHNTTDPTKANASTLAGTLVVTGS